ncbi:NADH-quinone oxidoreductase subunit NuoI [bacterium]|nr:NADH-quinone oxidoreductase subunit NuoI [bacterium]MBU1024585.1 NADH-quinone oxidoreductase subunit NuoI [bacterium]
MGLFIKISDVVESTREILRGLTITGLHIFKKPVTELYPEEPGDIYPRFRGRHALQRYENGMERCIGCSLCAAACPADAIYVVGAENNPDNPVSPGERHAEIYTINMLRCIFCGFCAEACPVEAVVLRHEYDFCRTSREAEIYTKDKLLDPPEKGFGKNLFTGGMGFENLKDL